MSNKEQQFTIFWNIIQSSLEVDEHKEVIKQAFLESIVLKTEQKEGKVSEKTRKTPKKSGYNMYMSHTMKVEGKKMAEACQAWKGLEDEKKNEWKNKAEAFNTENA